MRFGLRTTWRRQSMAEFDIDIARALGTEMEAIPVLSSYLLLLEPKFERLGECRETLLTIQEKLRNFDGSVYDIIIQTDAGEILTEGEYAVKLEQEWEELKKKRLHELARFGQ